MRRERQQTAEHYLAALADVDEIELPPVDSDRLHAWHLFPVRLRLEHLTIDRNQFIDALKEAGVGCSVHWRPLHLHPYYIETYGYEPGDLPTASALWPRLISLPIFAGMTGAERAHVAAVVRSIVAGNRRAVAQPGPRTTHAA